MLSIIRDMTSGLDLKLRRVAARVKVQAIAARMEVSASRISTIENQAVVTEDAAERYLAALATLTTVPSIEEAAS